MIKLFSLKQQKKDGETPRTGNQKKSSAAQLRIQKGALCFFLGLYVSSWGWGGCVFCLCECGICGFVVYSSSSSTQS